MTTIKTILFAGALALGMSACHHDTGTTTPAQPAYGGPVGNGAASNNYGTAGTGASAPEVTAPSAPDVNAQGGTAGQPVTGGESLANDQPAPGAPSTPGTGTGMQPNGTYGQPGTPGTPGSPGTENPTNPTTTGSTTGSSSNPYGTGSNTIPSAGSGSSANPYNGTGSNAVPGTTGTGAGSATGTGLGSDITNPAGTNPATGTNKQP